MMQLLPYFQQEQPEFDERIRRVEIDGVMYFSVLDVFTHYGKAKNSRTSWKTALARLEKQGFDSGREILQLQFEGERQRETPVATFKTMLRIAQVTDFKEWESMRAWMAEIAHERIEELANPELGYTRGKQRAELAYQKQGKSAAWMANRFRGIDARKTYTDVVQATHETNQPNFAALTAREYQEVLGMTKSEIVTALGLSKGQVHNFRDHLNMFALKALESAEMTAAQKMEMLGRQLSDKEQMEIIVKEAQRFAPVFRDAAADLGIDLATGRPLLKGEQ